MLKTTLRLLPVSVLLILSQACAGVSAPDANSINTAIAQTIVSGLTQTASAVAATTSTPESPTAAQTFTPELPAFTPTETLTPTPIFTSTPVTPQISVSVATNCRVGPGRVYERVGALLVGEVAEVIGRNPTGNYWYIRNPRQANGFCWLWGEYATLTGNTGALPVYTPPPTPTPTPNFEAFYVGKETCTGSWWVDLELENTGGISFRSISLTVRDTVTDAVVSMYADGFTDNSGCLASVTRDNLAPGASRVVSAPAFTYDFTGHRLRATITLCSSPGQNGMCITQVINFTP
ncbi:MAG TPA: SH3 domain-containing protein [Anaerolineales bacterium]